MSADPSTDLLAKLLAPILVLFVIGMAIEKILEKGLVGWHFICEKSSGMWAWIQVHCTPIIWSGIILVGIFLGSKMLKMYCPRVWKGLKIGCGICILIMIIMVLVVLFSNHF